MALSFIKFKKSSLFSLIFLKHYLLFINKKGSLFHCALKKNYFTSFFCNTSFIFVSFFNKNCPDAILRNLVLTFKLNLTNVFKTFILGSKKRVVIKGLGFKVDFRCCKNRNLINIKAGYSHRVLMQIPFSVNFTFTSNNNILLQNTNYIYLNLLSNLLFMIRKQNIYKQKGFFIPSINFISKATKKKTNLI